jgi:hypothetical protein
MSLKNQNEENLPYKIRLLDATVLIFCNQHKVIVPQTHQMNMVTTVVIIANESDAPTP